MFKNKKNINKFLPKGKKGLELEELGKWLIGIAILIILVGGAIYMKSKGIDMINYIKNLFSFRR